MAHDVFICHSSEDKLVANAACAKLEMAGIRCWIAPRDPIPGLTYGRQLVEAISRSRIVLLIFSAHANTSQPVLSEIELAANREVLILPFRIEDVLPAADLEFYIRKVHWLDAMTPPMEGRLDDLVERVGRLLETLPARDGATPVPPVPPPVPPPPVPPERRLVVTIAGANATLARGANVAFSYVALPGQSDSEKVEFVDAHGTVYATRIRDRERAGETVRAHAPVPWSAKPGVNLRLRVTAWGDGGFLIAGFSAPFTVAMPTQQSAPKPWGAIAAAGAVVLILGFGVSRCQSPKPPESFALPTAAPATPVATPESTPVFGTPLPRLSSSTAPSRFASPPFRSLLPPPSFFSTPKPIVWGTWVPVRSTPVLRFRAACDEQREAHVQRVAFRNSGVTDISLTYEVLPTRSSKPAFERFAVYVPAGASVEGVAALQGGPCAAATLWSNDVRMGATAMTFYDDANRADKVPSAPVINLAHDARTWSDWDTTKNAPKIPFAVRCDTVSGGQRFSVRFRNNADVPVSFVYDVEANQSDMGPVPYRHGIAMGAKEIAYGAIFTLPSACGTTAWIRLNHVNFGL